MSCCGQTPCITVTTYSGVGRSAASPPAPQHRRATGLQAQATETSQTPEPTRIAAMQCLQRASVASCRTTPACESLMRDDSHAILLFIPANLSGYLNGRPDVRPVMASEIAVVVLCAAGMLVHKMTCCLLQPLYPRLTSASSSRHIQHSQPTITCLCTPSSTGIPWRETMENSWKFIFDITSFHVVLWHELEVMVSQKLESTPAGVKTATKTMMPISPDHDVQRSESFPNLAIIILHGTFATMSGVPPEDAPREQALRT